MCYTMRMEKIDARKLSTDAQQQLRYQAIRLRGRKYKEIAEIISVQLTRTYLKNNVGHYF